MDWILLMSEKKWIDALHKINIRLTQIVKSGKGKVEIHITPRDDKTSVSMLAGENEEFLVEKENILK